MLEHQKAWREIVWGNVLSRLHYIKKFGGINMLLDPRFLNYSSPRPLSSSVVFQTLLDAEANGVFHLDFDAAIERSKMLGIYDTQDNFDKDVDLLLSENRIVLENAYLSRTSVWDDEDTLALQLVTVLCGNYSPYPRYLTLPIPAAFEIPADHPLHKDLTEAATLHLTSRLSISLVDSQNEETLLRKALARSNSYPAFLHDVLEISVSSPLEAPSVTSKLVLRNVLAQKQEAYHRFEDPLWLTTVVNLDAYTLFSPRLLSKLLLNCRYGCNVVLVIEKSILNSPTVGLVRDLIELGFPVSTIGKVEKLPKGQKPCFRHLVTKARMLISANS